MALAAVGLFLIGYQWGNRYQNRDQGRPTIGGVLIRPAIPWPAVQLRAAMGQPVDTESLTEHWTLLAFGRLDAADGQRAIGSLVETANRLAGNDALHDRLRLLLVSPDDQPALARDFERLSPLLIVASGTTDDIGVLGDAFGIDPTAARGTDDPPPVYLLGPGARLIALFPDGQAAAGIADDITALTDWPGLLHDGADSDTESRTADTPETTQ